MSLFRICASADDTEPFCSTLTDDPECCPAEALEMTRQTCIGHELTDTAWAERVEEL